jgi:hypothetical protein
MSSLKFALGTIAGVQEGELGMSIKKKGEPWTYHWND